MYSSSPSPEPVRFLCGALAALALLTSTAAAQLSITDTLPGTFIDISQTGTDLGLGFSDEQPIVTTVGNALFPPGEVIVGSSGGVLFQGPATPPFSTVLSLSEFPHFLPSITCFLYGQTLLPFWDDLDPSASGAVYVEEVGGTLVVQWQDVGLRNSFPPGDLVTFQLQVPTSGNVWARFIYQDVEDPGASQGAFATIGYQAWAHGNDVEFSFPNPASNLVSNGMVLSLVGTFSPPPPNDTCEGALPLMLGVPEPVAVDAATSQLSGTSWMCALGWTSPDVWFSFDANRHAVISATLCVTQGAGNLGVSVFRGACGALEELRCSQGSACSSAEPTHFSVRPGERYYLRVTFDLPHATAPSGILTLTEARPHPLHFVASSSATHADWVDISGTGLALGLGDEEEVDVFSSTMNTRFGSGVLRIGSNGGVRFAGAGNDLGPPSAQLPAAAAFGVDSVVLLPFWDDLDSAGGALGEVYWQDLPDRLVVQWQDVAFAGSPSERVTFQLQVPAAERSLARFVYRDVEGARAAGGGQALIGYQAGAQQQEPAVTWSVGLPGAVTDGTTLSLEHRPASVGVRSCVANANSTGLPAEMSAIGSARVVDDDLTLQASQLPAASVGYFLASDSAMPIFPGFIFPGSQGPLCLGGSIGRFVGPGQIQVSNAFGRAVLAIDLAQLPLNPATPMPGDTVSFTYWFRDQLPGGGATSNFADALSVWIE